jgi:hypothetical protein
MRSSRALFLPVVSIAVLSCLLPVQSLTAAEKVSARTVPAEARTAVRSASVVSNQIPVVEIPESVFVADFNDLRARDPFFPNAQYVSQQRNKRPDPIPVPKPVSDDSILRGLRITGLGGVGDKRWAMINGVTIYLGEAAPIQIGGRPIQVEFVEMSDQSVTVGIKGTATRREIKLN